MSKKRNNIRLQHVGKTPQEKESYQRFLRDYRYLDKTEERPTALEPTDHSSFDEEKEELPIAPVTPKSLKLRVFDFFKNNVGVGIILPAIVFLITTALWGYFTLASNVNSQNVKIDNLDKNMDDLNLSE